MHSIFAILEVSTPIEATLICDLDKFANTSGLSGDNFLAEDPVTDSVLAWSANGIVNGPTIATIEAAIAAAAAAAVSAASAAASAAAALCA